MMSFKVVVWGTTVVLGAEVKDIDIIVTGDSRDSTNYILIIGHINWRINSYGDASG